MSYLVLEHFIHRWWSQDTKERWRHWTMRKHRKTFDLILIFKVKQIKRRHCWLGIVPCNSHGFCDIWNGSADSDSTIGRFIKAVSKTSIFPIFAPKSDLTYCAQTKFLKNKVNLLVKIQGKSNTFGHHVWCQVNFQMIYHLGHSKVVFSFSTWEVITFLDDAILATPQRTHWTCMQHVIWYTMEVSCHFLTCVK